ncbi:hypothetical protein OAU61_03265 [Planktomarina temperata]|nr:hypothetical protein [Planktomarina temperata]MDB2466420.1 hypothetical protein [Planktomarina temperata]MDB2608195.1 hypothetical protein [Planktomarina temperata]MDC3265092.1 hypothetical protein [Planktomarina temperata]
MTTIAQDSECGDNVISQAKALIANGDKVITALQAWQKPANAIVIVVALKNISGSKS